MMKKGEIRITDIIRILGAPFGLGHKRSLQIDADKIGTGDVSFRSGMQIFCGGGEYRSKF